MRGCSSGGGFGVKRMEVRLRLDEASGLPAGDDVGVLLQPHNQGTNGREPWKGSNGNVFPSTEIRNSNCLLCFLVQLAAS
jgi:hypothetical protein